MTGQQTIPTATSTVTAGIPQAGSAEAFQRARAAQEDLRRRRN